MESISEPIEALIEPEALAMVRRAAQLQGRSLKDFVAAAVSEVARQTLEDTAIGRLSVADQLAFVNELLNPSKLAPAMQRAVEHHRRLVGPL